MAPKTIADSPEPRRARAAYRPIAAPDLDEAAEKEVAADPKLTRSVIGYFEPREGIDGKDYFNRCGSCTAFVPEAMMNGAVRGARCDKFGSDFPVSDDDGCNLYTPWPDGKPCVEDQEEAGEAMISGQRASVSPWDANYVQGKKRHCITCRHSSFDADGKLMTCGLLEEMNESVPAVFALDATIKPGAKCDLWTPVPPPVPGDMM